MPVRATGRRQEPPAHSSPREFSGVSGWTLAASVLAGLGLSGCRGPLSTLEPAGRDAEEIAELFWWMAGTCLGVWFLVMGLALYAVVTPKRDRKKTLRFIVGGGAVFPTVVLTAFLVFGLGKVPGLLAPGEAGVADIHVVGEQWWWRVQYQLPNGQRFELANELHLPVGKRVSIKLSSTDVIHSFWVPSLAGKVDMIPGRTNVLSLEPRRPGVFMGACAEYCGLSHAKMLLHAIVVSPDEFRAWADRQATEASKASQRTLGAQLFLARGCGACHTVRGSPANGVIGPDLTHVGGRHALGAGILSNDVAGFRRWLVELRQLKPDAHMPAFDMLSDAHLDALAHYLDGLE